MVQLVALPCQSKLTYQLDRRLHRPHFYSKCIQRYYLLVQMGELIEELIVIDRFETTMHGFAILTPEINHFTMCSKNQVFCLRPATEAVRGSSCLRSLDGIRGSLLGAIKSAYVDSTAAVRVDDKLRVSVKVSVSHYFFWIKVLCRQILREVGEMVVKSTQRI